jgi:2-hydroxychromene-2-carboxylate isomerase
MIPMLLGGVFKATGNTPPGAVPQKAKWMSKDLERYAEKYAVRFKLNDFFPINTLHLMRGALSSKKMGIFDRYTETIFRGIWIENLNLGDTEILKNYLEKLKINATDIFHLSQTDEIKNELIKNTEDAVKKGVFGAPSIFVEDEMFFGQDRLDFVESALKL